MKERILIVGDGGREHALGWKIKQHHAGLRELYFAPGNAGTQQIGINLDVEATDVEKLVGVASDKKINLTIVGPEKPLEGGMGNAFREGKLEIFGPTQEAARLETSKSWAIDFMKRHNIPHPESWIFNNPSAVRQFLENIDCKEIVIKADGLASGKGVFLPSSQIDALLAVERIMIDKEFEDGSKVIIQQRLKGREISFIAITDGDTIVPLLPAQDYKRLHDGDRGPNTGGMGGFAPVPLSQDLLKEIYNTILRPTMDGMREEGNRFQGALFAGLMLTDSGPKVLEYNVRFGDPETQSLVMLLKSDLLPALKNAAVEKLSRLDISFRKGAAVCVVIASEGYPDDPKTGRIIYGLDEINDPNMQIFHAGTKLRVGGIEAIRGRVVGITALGRDVGDARGKIYPYIGEKGIWLRGMQFRKDIGT